MFTTYNRFNRVALLASIILMVVLFAFVDSVSADALPNTFEFTSLYNHVQDNDSYGRDIPYAVLSHFGPYVNFDGEGKRENDKDLHSVTNAPIVPVTEDHNVPTVEEPTNDNNPRRKSDYPYPYHLHIVRHNYPVEIR